MDVAREQSLLLRTLGGWAAVSVAGGGALQAYGRSRGSAALAGAGQQTALWGAVDAGITAFGVLRARGGPVPEQDDAAQAIP